MSKVKVLNHDEDKLCNKCGKTVFVGLKGMTKVSSGMIDATVSFGYGDSVNELELYDGDEYRFSLCSVCLKDLFDSFIIPREERCLFPGHPQSDKHFDSSTDYEQLCSEQELKEYEEKVLADKLSGESFSSYTDVELVNRFGDVEYPEDNEYVYQQLIRKGIDTKEKVDTLFQQGNSELNNKSSIWKFSVDTHETDSFTVFIHKVMHYSKLGFVINPDNTARIIDIEPKENYDCFWSYIFVLDKNTNNYVPYSKCSKVELDIISNYLGENYSERIELKENFDAKYLNVSEAK